MFHVVRGLHPKFEPIAAVLRPQRGMSLDEVYQNLREEEVRINSRNGKFSSITEKPDSAFRTMEHQGKRESRPNDRKCYTCGKKGHIARDCWSRRTEAGNRSVAQRPGPHQKQGTQKAYHRKANEERKEQANIARRDHQEHAFSVQSDEKEDGSEEKWNPNGIKD